MKQKIYNVYIGLPEKTTGLKPLFEWFKSNGWQTTFGKPEDQTKTLKSNPYDLAIIDYQPTDCASIKELYEIKSSMPDITVFFYSKNQMEYDHIIYSLNEGADGIITGKIDLDKTIALIERKLKTHLNHIKLINKAHKLEDRITDLEQENIRLNTSLGILEMRLATYDSLINSIMEYADVYTGTKKIILVSDSTYQREKVRDFLQKKNISPLIASNISEAVALARTINPAIIVSDLELEDGTGKDLAQALKNDDQVKNPYVIIFTASQTPPDGLVAPEGPVDDYLTKSAGNSLVSQIMNGFYTIIERSGKTTFNL